VQVPYVIDNQNHLLADILNALLPAHQDRSLDVATAYFTVRGFGLVREGLKQLGGFRLLLGAEPGSGEQLGLKPDERTIKGLIRKDLEALPFGEETLCLVEELVAFLRRETVAVRLYNKGFLHAKCWLFYSDRPDQQMLFDRFRPILAIVGSSNFTGPGLTSNRELNLAHKVLLDPGEVEDPEAAYAVSWLADSRPSKQISPENRQLLKSEVGARAIIDLEAWYERQWQESADFKENLVELLDASKFGEKEYTPYQVYLKALFEYFRGELEEGAPAPTRSAVELAEFQEDAVKKARKILARYDGVMIADSVGLGKTWIGKKLLEDFAYHLRQKALVVCPASLREMWERELREATISAVVVSQEELGREEFEPQPWADADVVLIDESHNFRNRAAQRYENLERLLGGNQGRGRDGGRKKAILLTATPINNDLFDLYNQLALITRGTRDYFAACGIGDLPRYFLQARRQARTGDGILGLFNLLEEVVIRRTRPFIRKAYPEATIKGKRIHFPQRRLRTVQYDLEATYEGIYDAVVSGIDNLKLAPYNLEAFKKEEAEVDEFEAGREQALVGIFKSRYLKRFESSIEAFRISVHRALAFLKTFESYALDGRLLKSSDFHRALRYLAREDEEDDAMPRSLAEEMDASEEARRILESMVSIDTSRYDLRKLHEAVQHDVEALSAIWLRVKDIGPSSDAKLLRLKELLSAELRGRKVLIFSYFKDTARYLYRHLGHPDNAEAVKFCEELGNVAVRRMDSGADPKERERIVQGFAPRANDRAEWAGTEREIDILISTDVLSEGQNLQDCGLLINYDLHWNPTRMVQRAGRIDRIGTEFDTLWIYNMYPDQGLERLLGLVESLSRKIADIDQAGFLDASVLGEVVHPRNFNTLRRIREGDDAVIEEEEQFAELASNEFLLRQLREVLGAGGQEMLEALPDGIHSGLAREGTRGVFFYFQAEAGREGKMHFWKYCDLKAGTILDNRYLIANLIACERDTPRMVDPGIYRQIFDLQERVIENILEGIQEQRALEVAPRTVDPLQQSLATVIQGYINNPDVDRRRAITAIRFLNQPMLSVQIRELRKSYKEFQITNNIGELLGAIDRLREQFGDTQENKKNSALKSATQLRREDLRLICFEVVTS
jgi:superfamily II DNA or RNA helicase